MGMPSRLREVLQTDRLVVAPVCHDPLTARLVEALGFKAAYLGGFALGAATCLTEPLTTMSEMAEYAQRIARRISIPLVIDGNAGFGEPIHTIRAIREFEWGGVAGTHIEDQYYPKGAHYHKGVEHIISTEEIVMKIRAAGGLPSSEARVWTAGARGAHDPRAGGYAGGAEGDRGSHRA
jgi:methylisocitrate lyase